MKTVNQSRQYFRMLLGSGYAYAIYVWNLTGNKMERPETSPHFCIKDYRKELDEVFNLRWKLLPTLRMINWKCRTIAKK